MQQALDFQAAQDWPQAVRCLETILQRNPEHADALHWMGVAAHHLGDNDLAMTLLAHALSLQPGNPQFHSNLGNMQYQAGQLGAAEHSFRQALALDPAYASVHNDLAMVLFETARQDEAIREYRETLRLRPNNPDAWRNLGRLLEERGELDEAMSCYQRSVDAGQACYAEGYFQLGAGYEKQGKLEEAARAYQQAVRCQPSFAEAYNNLGAVCIFLGQLADARVCFDQAVSLNPELPMPYVGLGRLAMTSGDGGEAVRLMKKALAIKPDSGWAIRSAILFQMQRSPEFSSQELWLESAKYAGMIETPLRAHWLPHVNVADGQRRLKIGYVSADFYYHSVANYIEPILRHHDKKQFEVFCYYNLDKQDEVTARLKGYADHWVPCSFMTDDVLAERIRADQIDILVDLSGHTAHNRLMTFARKPAPVQATWIGFAGTTGLTAMDYRITDHYMDPPGLSERYHSEQLIRLPGSNVPFSPEACAPAVNELPALSSGQLTLSSLNTLNKINPQVARLWGRILAALPQARLMLGNVTDPLIRQRLLDLFQEVGVPEERLILHARMSMSDYLALHQQIDLGLDPFPFPGATSTYHSLWMGVPVITLAGDNAAARCGVATMGMVGLEQFITHSEEEYLQRTLEIVADLPALNRIRQSLRPKMQQTVCDAAGITRNLEAAYRDMWQHWCQRKGPHNHETAASTTQS